METSFIWPVSGSGDYIGGKIVYDKIGLLSSKNGQSNAFKWVKQALKGITFPRFRVILLNYDETVKKVIENDEIVDGGSYSENYQSGARRTLTFSLVNTDGRYNPSVFSLWAGQKILFQAGFYNYKEQATIYFNSGVFVIDSVGVSKTSQGSVVDVSCSDKFSILQGPLGQLPDGIEIKPNTNIRDIIIDTLHEQRGDGDVLDPKDVVFNTQFIGKTTPYTISLGSGSNYGELLLQLAEILSAEVFYDANGNLVFTPIVEVTQDGDKPLIHKFIDTDGSVNNLQFSFDYRNVVNYVKVMGGTVNGHICTAFSQNDSPESPISTKRIGIRRASPISDSAISSDIIAKERADYELRLKTIFTTSFQVNVQYNPTLSVNNLVGYTDNFFSLACDRFLISSVNYSISQNTQSSITISNINNLPFVTTKSAAPRG